MAAATRLTSTQASNALERRCGADRRHVDDGPPGRIERRRGLESRQPDVTELDMSNSEWGALSRDLPPPSKQ